MDSDKIRMWQQRIYKAESLQDDRSNERKQILKLYLGEFFTKPTDNSGEITEVNFVYEYIKVLVSSIYAKDPHIFARARIGQRALFAETLERVLNIKWADLKLKKKIKQSILDAVLSPPGFIEIGYLFLKDEKDKDEFTRQLEKEFPELKESEKMKVMEEHGIFDETIKEDDVFANYRSSYDVLWPDGYHDIRECPYMFIRWKQPLVDILSNPMFKSVKKQLINSQNFSSGKHPRQKDNKFTMDNPPSLNMLPDDRDPEETEITLYMVFDKREQKRFIIAKNFNKDTLWEKKWRYLIDGFPVYPLIFNDIPRTEDKANSYPLSDIVPMLPQLKELSKLSSAMMRHRKRSGAVILSRKGNVSPNEITNISKAQDLDFVEVENLDKNGIIPLIMPQLPGDFYKLRENVLEDLMRISGFPQLLSAGISGVETATESENIRLGATLRQSEKIDIIEDFTVDVAVGLAGLLWQFKRKEDIAEILGEDVSDEMWPDIPRLANGDPDIDKARKIIQKELLVSIEAGSTRPPKDEAVERKQWMDLIGVIKANFPGRLRDDVILTQILKKFDFKDIDSAVIQFDEAEQQRAVQENQLLLQGIPLPVGPNDMHKIHLQIHGAQAESGQSSPALDQHILQHAQFEQQLSPTVSPQQGDSKISPQSTTPELARRGVPENQDFVGAANNIQPGANKGNTNA